MMEDISKDITVSEAVLSSAFSHLLNLEKYDMHLIPHMLQQFFGINHTKCQPRQAATGDLNAWIQELASALTSDLDTLSKKFFAESKVQAMKKKMNLPAVSRVCRAFTD